MLPILNEGENFFQSKQTPFLLIILVLYLSKPNPK